MKKWMIVLLSVVIVFSSFQVVGTVGAAASSNANIEVLLDGRKISFPDARPFQDAQGSVMVPIRFVSETLGAKVEYSKENSQMVVEVESEDHSIQMKVGDVNATVNGKKKSYGKKVVLKQNRTFVPLRLVSEGLGQTVEWDKVSRWVWIGKKEVLTLEEAGLEPVSIDPYKKWFTNKQYLLKSPREDVTYDKVLIFRETDLPAKFLRDIYSIDLFTEPKSKAVFLKVRSKTTSTAGNLFYLTNKNDIRYRNPVVGRTINNSDGTKYDFYSIWSPSDKTLDGIVDEKILELNDIHYIGFRGSNNDYIPLMINPWRRK